MIQIILLFLLALPTVTSPITPHFPKDLDVNKPSSKKRPAPEQPAAPTKPKKVRKRHLKPKAERKKTFSNMNFDEMKAFKDKQMANKSYETAARCLERMIVLCPEEKDTSRKAGVTIELADLLFEQQRYEEASKHYLNFTREFPGNKLVEHASYRSIVCSFKGILNPDRDQTKTEDTIALADKFLERVDVFTKYADEVRSIRRQCHQVLAVSELKVTEFYINVGEFKAAEQRLAHARTEWLSKIPEVASTIANLEVALAQVWPEFKPVVSMPALSESITVADSGNGKSEDLIKNPATVVAGKKKSAANRF